uniref:CRIB domain-containing protein n=1 Tax=Oryza punctata TaxID=4537 RepID=A0A0E0LER5_ORYPU
MEIKMKGIFKGLKIISQIFALQKQHEMEIGCPTDVRHVSHIGVGTSDACPSWVRISYLIAGIFRPSKSSLQGPTHFPSLRLGLEELSAGSMGSFAQSRKTSWASQGKYLPRSLPSVHLYFEKPPRTTLPTESCPDNSGHDIPRGPKNPRRKKTARASSASSFLSRSRSSSFATACGDFSELRGALRVA